MPALVIGLDVGTTSTKALVVEDNGVIVSRASAALDLVFPHPGWAEQDPQQLWQQTLNALTDALSALSPEQRQSVRAISISNQRDTLVPLDAEGSPVRNAITWMDSRAHEECREFSEHIGDWDVYQMTGVPISTIWTGAFVRWMKNNEPRNFDRTACFCLVHDFVMSRLGADGYFVDYANACETMMFDMSTREWSEPILDFLSLDTERLGQLCESGTPIGTVSERLARDLDISPKTVLVAGGGDQQCAALGAGAISEGDIEIGIGTAANILAPIRQPQLDSRRQLLCHSHTYPGMWVLEGALVSAASTLQWVRDIAYNEYDHERAFELINAEVTADSKPGAGGLLCPPHFEGAGTPYWNSSAKGIMLGLTLSTSRADMARSVMEGISLEIRNTISILGSWGMKPRRALLTGGSSRSDTWSQIQADIYQLPTVVLEYPDAAAIGAAILAGHGAGVFSSVDEGVERLVKIRETFEPRSDRASIYRRLGDLQDKAYRALDAAGVYHELVSLKNEIDRMVAQTDPRDPSRV